MKNLSKIFVAAMILITSIACQSPRNKSLDHINALEQSLLDTQTFTFDPEKAAELSMAYRDFIHDYPDDTLSAGFMFKLSEISSAIGKHGDAVNYLDELIDKYPDWRKLPDAMFLKGFILEDKMQNNIKARKAYQELIDRYPNHPFSENARIIIDNLGITSDSLIKRFEAMQDMAPD